MSSFARGGALRGEALRGGAGRCGAGRAAGYDLATFAVRVDCGPSYCGAGRAEGQEMTNMRGGADCGLNCNLRGGLRAQISSPPRALICTLAKQHI